MGKGERERGAYILDFRVGVVIVGPVDVVASFLEATLPAPPRPWGC
jgi:hypothetical protein